MPNGRSLSLILIIKQATAHPLNKKAEPDIQLF